MRSRPAACLAFLAAAAAVCSQAPVRGQAGGKLTADIRYLDPKDGKEVSQTLEVKKESAAGVDLVTGGGVVTVPPDKIVSVVYKGQPGLALDLINSLAADEAADPAKAAQRYADLAAKSADRVKRFAEFRGAVAALKVADSKAGAEFDAEAKVAAQRLADVAKAHAGSWEVWPAGRSAARLLQELGQFDAAAKQLAQVASAPGLPKPLAHEARLAQAAALIRAGNAKDAEAVLGPLAGDASFPASGSLRQTLVILQAAAKSPAPATGADGKPARPADAVKKLEDAIGQASDPEAKAVGYGLLGDLYSAHGFPRDAMWAYLWVDTVYPEAKDVRVLAVRRLAASFDAQGDKERADQYREKLARVR